MVVSFYKILKFNLNDIILAKMKKILIKAQDMAKEDGLEDDLWDFSMEVDVAIGKSLPDMLLRVMTTNLRGDDPSTFNRLNNKAQYVRKTWQFEVASKHATKIKGFVQMAKDYGIVKQLWGIHEHLSKVTDIKLAASKANKQVEMAQKPTNYEVLMTVEELVGVIDLDHPNTIPHPTTQKPIVSYTLGYALLNFVKMSNGCSAIAEVHQSGLSKLTHIIIPNMPEAEQLVGMMNNNLTAFLFHTLQDQGLPNDFIDSLLKNSCEATMLADMSRCTWDSVNWVLTTKDELTKAEKTKAFKGAAWF
jgi:hypothetical protein